MKFIMFQIKREYKQALNIQCCKRVNKAFKIKENLFLKNLNFKVDLAIRCLRFQQFTVLQENSASDIL